jgi:hypothetical protein
MAVKRKRKRSSPKAPHRRRRPQPVARAKDPKKAKKATAPKKTTPTKKPISPALKTALAIKKKAEITLTNAKAYIRLFTPKSGEWRPHLRSAIALIRTKREQDKAEKVIALAHKVIASSKEP